MESIENINYPAPKQEYKVLVRCFTYNHSKYIADALNGFAMQQTNFPYVCLVMDDASTDGEQEVIKVWMERECDMSKAETIDIPTSIVIVVPHKTNASCTFAFYLLKQNLYRVKEEKMMHVTPWREQCAYEAMCEGDDYWIDPLKLQKQVDFLESNGHYGLCFGYALQYNEQLGRYNKKLFGGEIKNPIVLLKDNIIQTPTVLIRKSLIDSYELEIGSQNWLMGDYPLWLFIAIKCKIHFIDEVLSVYRIIDDSASHKMSIDAREYFIKSTFDIKRYFINKYNIEYNYDLDSHENESLLSNAYYFKDYSKVKGYYKLISHPTIKVTIKYLLSIFHAWR